MFQEEAEEALDSRCCSSWRFLVLLAVVNIQRKNKNKMSLQATKAAVVVKVGPRLQKVINNGSKIDPQQVCNSDKYTKA